MNNPYVTAVEQLMAALMADGVDPDEIVASAKASVAKLSKAKPEAAPAPAKPVDRNAVLEKFRKLIATEDGRTKAAAALKTVGAARFSLVPAEKLGELDAAITAAGSAA